MTKTFARKKNFHASTNHERKRFDGRVSGRASSKPLLRGFFPRLLTVADLAVLPSELPSGPVVYELDNGRLVAMPPPGAMHGKFESNLVTDLKLQGERPGLGKVFSGGSGLVLWRDPDRVVGPDAVFIANRSLPVQISKEGYLETIPDLVVEVRSKNDTGPEISKKVRDYLKAGVRVIWVADPTKRTVTIHRRGGKTQVLREGNVLTVEDIIPGFEMPVKDVFEV